MAAIETLYNAGHLLLIVGLLHKNNSNIRLFDFLFLGFPLLHFEVTFVSNIYYHDLPLRGKYFCGKIYSNNGWAVLSSVG